MELELAVILFRDVNTGQCNRPTGIELRDVFWGNSCISKTGLRRMNGYEPASTLLGVLLDRGPA